MSGRRVRWGVVGAGGIARRRTIPEGILAADNARLAVVYDVDPAVAQAVAQEGAARVAPSLDELIASDVDAVYVASPVDAHVGPVVAAARAGNRAPGPLIPN